MKIVVISAVNLRSGGPLSVLNDCLRVLNDNYSDQYRIIALVNKKDLFLGFDKIEFLEFPKSASAYFYRIYLEYFYFKKMSNKLKPYLWFSLHDITPNVVAQKRAVYCHNAAPFYRVSLREAFLEPNFFILNFFYEYFYSKNIACNDFVVVQQDWLRSEFIKRFDVDNVVVAYPSLDSVPESLPQPISKAIDCENKFIFFYPAFARVFKNMEVLCEASKLLMGKGVNNFEVWLTVDGTENKYSKAISARYKGFSNIKFMGLQSRETVLEWYQHSDALVFPSKLETWGLPITEFKLTGKPMLIADLPYAHETVGNYEQVAFFSHTDSNALAENMIALIEGRFLPEGNAVPDPKEPFVEGWSDLLEHMLR